MTRLRDQMKFIGRHSFPRGKGGAQPVSQAPIAPIDNKFRSALLKANPADQTCLVELKKISAARVKHAARLWIWNADAGETFANMHEPSSLGRSVQLTGLSFAVAQDFQREPVSPQWG